VRRVCRCKAWAGQQMHHGTFAQHDCSQKAPKLSD
jgi:hypothetical protein